MATKKPKDKIVRKIIITMEESIVDGKIVQKVDFQLDSISKFEALGLLRLYEQNMSIDLLRHSL